MAEISESIKHRAKQLLNSYLWDQALKKYDAQYDRSWFFRLKVWMWRKIKWPDMALKPEKCVEHEVIWALREALKEKGIQCCEFCADPNELRVIRAGQKARVYNYTLKEEHDVEATKDIRVCPRCLISREI